MKDEGTVPVSGERSVRPDLRVLQLGPTHRRGKADTNIWAGNAVMLREQQRELAARGCRPETVDTSGPVTNLPSAVLAFAALLRFLRVSFQTARRMRRNDVVCSILRPERMFDFGAALWLLSRALRRPLVLRVSGGSFGTAFSESGRRRRWIADRTAMRAEIVYIETLDALDKLPRRDNLKHFPNTRRLLQNAQGDRSEVRKLLFLSRIRPDKGLRECLQASLSLPEDCKLSIYGAAHTGFDLAEIDQYPLASYRGIAKPEEVPGLLAEHDLMLLPTYFHDEGLPGTILEAFQTAMPVISTPVGGIPELVEHEVTGLLVEPRSVPDLTAAIRRLIEEPELYRRLCEGAKRRGDDFRSDRWYDRFASDLSLICGSGQAPGGAD